MELAVVIAAVVLGAFNPAPDPTHVADELANCRAQHRPECPLDTPTPTTTSTPVPTSTATPVPSATPTVTPTFTPTPEPTPCWLTDPELGDPDNNYIVYDPETGLPTQVECGTPTPVPTDTPTEVPTATSQPTEPVAPPQVIYIQAPPAPAPAQVVITVLVTAVPTEPTQTPVPTLSPTPTATPTLTARPTSTQPPTSTPTGTALPSPTVAPTQAIARSIVVLPDENNAAPPVDWSPPSPTLIEQLAAWWYGQQEKQPPVLGFKQRDAVASREPEPVTVDDRRGGWLARRWRVIV